MSLADDSIAQKGDATMLAMPRCVKQTFASQHPPAAQTLKKASMSEPSTPPS